MRIKVRIVHGLTVLGIEGNLTLLHRGGELQEKIREALDSGRKNIVFDTAQVDRVDSDGIGELLRSYTTVTRRGGRLSLVALPDKLREILVRTRLDSVFSIYEDEAMALKEVSGSGTSV